VGDLVVVTFNAYAPADDFSFAVTTSANTTPESTSAVSISSQVPTFSASSLVAGANAAYTIEAIDAPGATGGPWADNPSFAPATQLQLVAVATAGSGTLEWSSSFANGYLVTYVTPGGAATTDTVQSVAATTTVNADDTVTLALAEPIPEGDMINIMGECVNPVSGGTDEATIEAGTGTGTTFVGEGPTETTGTVTYVASP
jgi:hypothetical protein